MFPLWLTIIRIFYFFIWLLIVKTDKRLLLLKKQKQKMLPRGGDAWVESWRICKRQVKWFMLILSVGPLTVVSSKALMLLPVGGGPDSQRRWVTCWRSTIGTWTWKSLSRVLCKLGEMRLQKAVFRICMWAWTRVWEGLNYGWFDLCVEMKLLCLCTWPPKSYIAVIGAH